jgi:phospholipid/cholesterol/gamma-HCH transport system substrate-binding protein
VRQKYAFLGGFVILTTGLFLWLAASVGALGTRGGDRYVVRMEHAAGLVEDNAVKIAGVAVGVVERIDVDHATAVLTLRLDKEVVLHADSVAIVRAKSLLGEKYLQLEPGTLDQPVLEPGGEITRVQTTFEVDELLNALEPVLGGDSSLGTSLVPLARRVDGMLAAAQGEDGQPPIVDREQLREAVDNTRRSVEIVRRILETNEQGIKDLVDNSNRVLGDPRLPRIVENVDRASSDLPELIARADRVLAALERASGQLDETRAAEIGQSIDDLAAAAADLRKLSEDMRGVSQDVGPLIEALAVLAERAAAIDERALRKFLQSEGIRINLGAPRRARDELRRLGVDD